MAPFQDLTGQKFGKLTVIKRDKNKGGNATWLCKCECGNTKIVQTRLLKCGNVKSCGCLHSKNLIGKRFGKLIVIKKMDIQKNRQNLWLCKCDCGKQKIVMTYLLTNGNVKSCGCLQKERAIQASTKHGQSKNRIYHIWRCIIQRCTKPSYKNYKNYGGRGIAICDEWKNDFINFYDWAIANGFKENAKFGECTIDRIDVNGNYEPNNCRWISIKEQANNKRDNRVIIYNGQKHNIKEWSEILKFKYYILWQRLTKLNWSVEKAFTTPVRGHKG